MKAQVIGFPSPPPEVVVTMTVEEAHGLLTQWFLFPSTPGQALFLSTLREAVGL